MFCRLCLNDRELCGSHIIPEFFYRPTYDTKHRAYELELATFGERYLQKGYREALLCKPYEDKIGKHEAYVAQMWYQQGVLPDEMLADSLVICGLDYARFKLFHLSVLWRASISTGRMFERIALDADAERIRQMLLSEDPGDEDQYGFFAEVLVDDASPRVLHELIMQPLGHATVANWVRIGSDSSGQTSANRRLANRRAAWP